MDFTFLDSAFFEISAVLIIGALFASIAKFLKQPLIPAYILAGVVLGPPLLNIIGKGELLDVLAEFGIAFLLFLVGIELDIRKLLKTGKVALSIGTIQMVFAIGGGYFLTRALGFESADALFLSIALGFSSTIVILKILGERKETHTLYANIVIGLMLTQDFFAVVLLIFFNVFTGQAGEGTLLMEMVFAAAKGVLLIGFALVAAKFILSKAFKYFARSPELLFLGSISWCLFLAMGAYALGFSIEVGSLAAGVSLGFMPYSVAIATRIKSLRDFFLPIFFAVLGGQLVFGGGGHVIIPAVVLSSFVLFASPIIVTGFLLWFGYRARTSFQAGMAIGQVSEFSFILVNLGFASGIIGQNIVSLVALIGLLTMTLSTYMMKYSDSMYVWFRQILKKFERKGKRNQLDAIPELMSGHAIIFGYSTMGSKAEDLFHRLKEKTLVVDNNPDVIEKLQKKGIPRLYGNLNEEDIFEEANVAGAKYILSSVPNKDVVMGLLAYVKKEKLKCKVIVTAFTVEDALAYYTAGANFVLYPTFISADYLEDLLKEKRLSSKRTIHMKQLKKLALAL